MLDQPRNSRVVSLPVRMPPVQDPGPEAFESRAEVPSLLVDAYGGPYGGFEDALLFGERRHGQRGRKRRSSQCSVRSYDVLEAERVNRPDVNIAAFVDAE